MTKRILNCQIHLMPSPRERAAKAVFPGHSKEVIENRAKFVGPTFENIETVRTDDGFVQVVVTDLSAADPNAEVLVYTYPLHQVARIKTWSVSK